IDGMGRAAHAFERFPYHLLQRMAVTHIATMVDIPMRTNAEEACMLARAVVVELAWRGAGARQRDHRALIRRPMRAAFAGALVKSRFCQHGARHSHMRGLAGVGSAGKRNLAGAEAVGVRR